MSDTHISKFSGVIREISAAEDANLVERELPTGDGAVRRVAGVPAKLGRQFRKVQLDGYDADAHTVTMAVSSSTPVDRYYGVEILSHDKGALDTSRLKGGVSLLFNHDMDALLGRSQSFEFGDPLRVTARFGTSELAQQMEKEVAAGILTDVSIGYLVDEWEITEDKNGARTYTAVKWQIYEVSLVTVPADPTVGVGRDAQPVKVRSFRSAKDEAEDTGDEENEDDPEEDDDGETGSETSRTTTPIEQRTAPAMAEPTNTSTATTTVDHAAENKTRIAGLRALRTQYKDHFSEEQFADAVANGTDERSVRNSIGDAIIADNQRIKVASAAEGVFGDLSAREKKRYSLRNAYCAAVNRVRSGSFAGKEFEAGLEVEVSNALTKEAEKRGIGLSGGIVIPGAASRALLGAQERAMNVGTVGTAGVPTILEQTSIEILRSKVVCMALGAQTLTGVKGGKLQIPRQNAAAQSNWLAESAAATESDITFDSISMYAHRLQMWNAYTMDFLAESPLAIDSLLAADRMAVLARSLDFAGINGPGTGNAPLGLLLQSGLAQVLAGSTRSSAGVLTAGAGGVPPTFVDINNMEAAISTLNGDIGTMRWAFRPKMRAAMRSIPQIPGTASAFIMPNSKVGPNGIQEGPLGYDCIASTQVPTGYTANSVSGLDAIILGVWDQMLFADWDISEVIVDPFTGASTATVNINEFSYWDTNVRHIPAFAACTSALGQ